MNKAGYVTVGVIKAGEQTAANKNKPTHANTVYQYADKWGEQSGVPLGGFCVGIVAFG